MSPRGRTVLIVVVVSMLLFACGAASLTAGAVAEYARKVEWDASSPSQIAPPDRTFSVGASPSLDIRNFAGRVLVRTGPAGAIRVTASKTTSGEVSSDQIRITVLETENGVSVGTDAPDIPGRASVALEITVPIDTRVDVWAGAGEVEIIGIQSDVDVRVGAGIIAVRETRGHIRAKVGAGTVHVDESIGSVDLESNVGAIIYRGTPQGQCTFDTDVGGIAIELPKGHASSLDLQVDAGAITVRVPVVGHKSRRQVQGHIGKGDAGQIHARTLLGGIGVTAN